MNRKTISYFAAVAALVLAFDGKVNAADDYSLAVGETDTWANVVTNYAAVSVAGDLVINNVTTGKCTSATIRGVVTVDGSATFFGGVTGSSGPVINFYQNPDKDVNAYGQLVLTNGGVASFYYGVVYYPGTGYTKEYLDFLRLSDGGQVFVRRFDSHSKLISRITVTGTGGVFGSTENAEGYFRGDTSRGYTNFVVYLDHAPLTFYSNSKGWNCEGIHAVTEGIGDLKILNNSSKSSSDSPMRFRNGAYFNHQGAFKVSRPTKGSNWAHFIVEADNMIGPNVTGLYMYKNLEYSSKPDGVLNLEIASGVHTWFKTLEVESGSGCYLSGAGTLQLGAESGTSLLQAMLTNTTCTLTIEKLGSNELLVNGSHTNMPTLKLTAGNVRIAKDMLVSSLVANGGTFTVDNGKVFRIEAGLSGYTGAINPAAGGDWERGVYTICYFKGEDPDFAALTAPVDFNDKFTFASEELSDGDYAGYKVLKLTVEDATKTFSITESGEIDVVGKMGGSLSAPCVLEISSGVTATNTTALTGDHMLTVRGGGTLVQKVASPAFTGEIYIGAATVVVSTDNPLGTGKITIAGYEGAGDAASRILCANTAAEITIPNEIVVAKQGGNTTANIINSTGALKVTFTGPISASDSFVLSDAHGTTVTPNILWSITNTVTVTGNIIVAGPAGSEFKGKVTATGCLRPYCSASGRELIPRVHVYCSENSIAYIYSRRQGELYAEGENAWGRGYLTDEHNRSPKFSLGVYDQTIKYMAFNGYCSNAGALYYASVVADDGGATLTLNGTGTRTTKLTKLTGKLNLVVDGEEDSFVQNFQGGASTMTGSIEVKKGTMRLQDHPTYSSPITMANVPSITLSGGNFQFSGTNACALAAVTNLAISAGTFTVDGTGKELFGTDEATKAVAEFSGTGTMNIAAGQTVYVSQAMTNDVWLKAGTYTGEAGVEGAVVIPQLTGSGVLSVQRNGTAGTVLFIR